MYELYNYFAPVNVMTAEIQARRCERPPRLLHIHINYKNQKQLLPAHNAIITANNDYSYRASKKTGLYRKK